MHATLTNMDNLNEISFKCKATNPNHITLFGSYEGHSFTE